MAFHAILATRDEDDIIAQSIKGFLDWADEIHIFDTGSVDNTWDIVQDLAKTDHRVRPVERSCIWFSDQYRGYCFDRVRNRFRKGDWFLRVDSDEFYHISPPDFVDSCLRRGESCVYQQYYDFRLTSSEAVRLSSEEAIREERKMPIETRRICYTLGTYSEPRLARYRCGMLWPANYTWPKHAGLIAERLIPVRHYPNRDPLQLKKRMLIRRSMVEADINRTRYTKVHHWREDDWRSHIVDANAPGVQTWKPGQELTVTFVNGSASRGLKRAAKYAANIFVAPVMDYCSRHSCEVYSPELVDQGMIDKLQLQFDESRNGLSADSK